MRARAVAAIVTLGLASCAHDAAAPSSEARTYLERRAAHRTKLTRLAGIGEQKETPVPDGARREAYRSAELDLFAWVMEPAPQHTGARPALVYFHGGFELTAEQLQRLRPWVDEGFVVIAPVFRGRMGNPGSFELVYGEVDDARAAVQHAAQMPGVDAQRMYAFGHSMGGAAAAMLSLYPDAPARLTGSCGGVYSLQTFGRWANGDATRDMVRFDVTDRDEIELRLIAPHAAEVVHRHIAYAGADEQSVQENARLAATRAHAAGRELELRVVEGDHMSALAPALADFLSVVREDIVRAR